MLQFKTVLQQFQKQGEKTGWTYISISSKQAAQLLPGNRIDFRVKGRLDDYAIKQVAIIPMGDGNFILPVNAAMRKGLRKTKGAEVEVRLELDIEPIPLDEELMNCLNDEPKALQVFQSYTKSHQAYFSKWIVSAKTEPTKAKRIALTVNALLKGWDYGQMLRASKKERDEMGL